MEGFFRLCTSEAVSAPHVHSFPSVVELPENWTDTKETLLEGMVFNVKYLGMTLVGQPKGEDMASAAIRRIVAMVNFK